MIFRCLTDNGRESRQSIEPHLTCDPGVFPAIPRKVSSVMTLCLYTKSYLCGGRDVAHAVDVLVRSYCIIEIGSGMGKFMGTCALYEQCTYNVLHDMYTDVDVGTSGSVGPST